jgi:plasmid stabilization system protein ParE
MSVPTFEFHPEALLEAWAARRWYGERSPRAADAFWEELEQAKHQVIENPERWATYLHGTRRYVFRKFPYAIVYFVMEDRILAVAVAHAKLRPGYWKDRLAS